MILIRNIMFCKPGKVRPMVEKFKAMNRIGARSGMPPMRILTDFSSERYWMVVAEMEATSVDEHERRMQDNNMSAEDKEEYAKIMADYHDLVESGRREIYKIEG